MLLSERHSPTVEPAVDNIRDAVHGLAAFRALEVDVIHIRTMQFDGFVDVFDGFFDQFFPGAGGFQMAAFAPPDVQRSAPVTASGDGPVIQVFQPVAETLFTHEIREPVDLVVFPDQYILDLGHFDVPAGLSIIQQRCLAAPAMRIVMHHLLLGEELAFLSQPFDDLRVCIHNELTFPGGGQVFAVFCYGVHHLDPVSPAGIVVVFTEGAGGVNNAGTVFRGDVICAGHEEGFPFNLHEGHQLFIFLVFQVLALHFFQDFIFTLQNGRSQSFRQVIDIAVFVFHLHIVHFRAHCHANVGGQGPGGGGPCQEVFAFCALLLEAHSGGLGFDLLIAQGYFVGSQSRSAPRTVRQDLVSFIDESFFEELVQDPPGGFDVVIVQSDIGVFQVYQITHSLGHLSPLSFVSEDGFPALFIEFRDAVFFDLRLGGDPQLLFHFDLYRQSVGVPTGLPLDLITLHGLVSQDGVLQGPGHNVVDARLAVGSRRSFIEHEGRHVCPGLDAFV